MAAGGKLHFRCPHCDKPLAVAQEHAGKRGTCRGCGMKVQIPSAPAQQSATYSVESLTEGVLEGGADTSAQRSATDPVELLIRRLPNRDLMPRAEGPDIPCPVPDLPGLPYMYEQTKAWTSDEQAGCEVIHALGQLKDVRALKHLLAYRSVLNIFPKAAVEAMTVILEASSEHASVEDLQAILALGTRRDDARFSVLEYTSFEWQAYRPRHDWARGRRRREDVSTSLLQQLAGQELKLRASGLAELDLARAILKLGGRFTTDDQNPQKPIVGIDFRDKPITDADLKSLKKVDSLQELDLRGTAVTAAALMEVKNFKNLRTLHLSGPQVTDSVLKDLSDMENLRALRLEKTNVTLDGLKVLKEFRSLDEVGPFNEDVGDSWLRHFKELGNLRTLHLYETKVTDHGLKELWNLRNLQTLGLGGTKVTNACLQILQQMMNLREVILVYTAVTEAGAKELRAARPDLKVFM